MSVTRDGRRLVGLVRIVSVLWFVVVSSTHRAEARPPMAYDVAVALGPTSSVVVEDEDLAEYSPSGPMVSAALPAIPREAAINGFTRDGTDVLFSLDVTAVVEGVTLEPRDVARWNGTALSVDIDGSAVGIQNGLSIDAIAVSLSSGQILLSVDSTTIVGALVVDDEDLFRPAPVPLVVFDGSAEGIDPSLDLVGAGLLTETLGVFTFDGSGQIDGIDFDDEDLVTWDFLTGEFDLYLDGSVLEPTTIGADVRAVPEPSPGTALPSVGAIMLLAIGLGKRCRPRRSI